MDGGTPQIETRCGTIAIVGEPNAGKSTLLNALVGQPLAITSANPQTTRCPVIGVRTDDETQLIFVDHPGLLDPRYLLHRAMREASIRHLQLSDAVLHVHPASVEDPAPLEVLLPEMGRLSIPVAQVRTKADRLRSPPATPGVPPPDRILVSATEGAGLEELVGWCRAHVPAGPFRYDPDDISNQPVRFFVSEYVREAAFELLAEELPYAVAAEVDEYREGSQPLYIRVTIYVERESQKRMVIGRGGRMIKQLGTRARARIEPLVGETVFLDLWVKVIPKWRSSAVQLARFGLPVTESP